MDMNLTVLAGKLAAPPELRRFESGSCLVRSLVTVRSSSPRRRVDVIPVTLWDPPADHEIIEAIAGRPVWVVGTVQRRFWSVGEARQSRLEVVAHHVELVNSTATVATTDNAANGGGG
ncbi:MAG: single-stranded DNA-binding protein [Acidimicrobiia bacterium]|nr:single-stranded DNA-binding protein [Acidimicrobiia bacterium]